MAVGDSDVRRGSDSHGRRRGYVGIGHVAGDQFNHPWGASRREPMDERIRSQIWDLAAGTFIAVSVFSGMAFIIVSAVRL